MEKTIVLSNFQMTQNKCTNIPLVVLASGQSVPWRNIPVDQWYPKIHGPVKRENCPICIFCKAASQSNLVSHMN